MVGVYFTHVGFNTAHGVALHRVSLVIGHLYLASLTIIFFVSDESIGVNLTGIRS